jgi:DNA-binding transcriptional regulator PaaX
MGHAELERALLRALAALEKSGAKATQAELIAQARDWAVDEFSVRDALSKLVEEEKIVLTNQRDLRPIPEKVPA